MKVKIRINNVPVHATGQLSLQIAGGAGEIRDYHCDNETIREIYDGSHSATGMNRIYAKPYDGETKEVSGFEDVEGVEIEVPTGAEIVFGLTKWFKKNANEKGEIEVDFAKDKKEISDADRRGTIKN